jgi:hypothetical protein
LTLPIPVTRALRKLGHDIKDAGRRIPAAIVARRGLTKSEIEREASAFKHPDLKQAQGK